MPNFEARVAQIERQLGRELTPEERQLMHLWYVTFGAKKPKKAEKPIKAKPAIAAD